jgi:methyltransferase (TIGR00027 family)
MLPGHPSQTLLLPAICRAAHQLLDTPRILEDPVAIDLIPEASHNAILRTAENYRSRESILLRSLFAMRNRFAEDRLAQAAARGVRQYVIIGLGLDTFPWRQPDFTRDMRIFAADHVATLAWSQVQFWSRGLPKPNNLTFVPVDLEKRNLHQCLLSAGFDSRLPSFCSVLGVLQYIDRNAVSALLRFASSLHLGSEIVFSFALPDDASSPDNVTLRAETVARAVGEPWKTRQGPTEVSDELNQLGFREVFHLTPELAQQCYFAGRQDELRAPHWVQLMAAIV